MSQDLQANLCGSFTENFLQSILSNIDSRDAVVANAWLDTLLDVIDLLPVDVLGKEILNIAVNKAKDGQPTFSRLGSCQLVGKLGLKLEQQAIKDELIPLAQNLSHDSEWTVRASMCSQLLSVTKGLTKAGENFDAKSPLKIILSILFELGDDEMEAVRLVVIETVSSILQYLDEESVKTMVVSWIQKICNQALKVEDKMLPLLAQHWARISRTLQAYLSDEEKVWFVDFYFYLASLGSSQHSKDRSNMPDVIADTDNGQNLEIYAEVRHACAVNSAALVHFVGPEVVTQRFSSLWSLAVDPYFVVRRAVAANLLDLCRVLGKVIHPLLNQLLVDPCVDVIFALVPQVGAVIEHLARLGPAGPFVDESVVIETCGAVLRCEEQVMNTSSWRMQSDMLSQLAVLPLCLPCNAVHDLLIPRLWQRIEILRPLPCRVAAAQTLMICVRSERRAQERSTLISTILGKLASAQSCHRRLLFLRVSPILFDLLSRRFIRKEFFLPIVRLAGDKVANVRLRFATLLPKLHISLRGLDPVCEKQLIVELDSSIRFLVESEKDRDVKEELAKFFRWVEEQEKLSRSDPEYQKRMKEEEEADRTKEDEERLVLHSYPEPVQVVSQSETTAEPLVPAIAPFFPSGSEPVQPASTAAASAPTQATERSDPLDPSTDDFFRDAGVRLTTASPATPRPPPRNPTPSGESISRIPSIQPSKLKQPSTSGLFKSSSPALPHFGIARGVQQIQPQPSMAYGVAGPSSVTSPQRIQRRAVPPVGAASGTGGAQLNAAKSRSQESLVPVSPRPKTARPISTCLGSNDLLQAGVGGSNKSVGSASAFNRTRFRASIGAPSSAGVKSASTPPIATLPPGRNGSDPSKWSATNRPSVGPLFKTSGAAGATATGTVKLSDMKNALPITPVPPRKLSGADLQSVQQFGRGRRLNNTAGTDEAAAQLMDNLDLGGASVTRLRKPATTAAGIKPRPGSSMHGSTESSPLQRSNPWRRSLNFNIAVASSSPPPPPPRKSYATLPRIVNNNNGNSGSSSSSSTSTSNNTLPSGNNNNNNTNSNNNNNPSKLPVPAFKRNSYLGSNF